MVRLLHLGALLGLALSCVSPAAALPQTDAKKPKPPACKGMTKREEWYAPFPPFLHLQTTTNNNTTQGAT